MDCCNCTAVIAVTAVPIVAVGATVAAAASATSIGLGLPLGLHFSAQGDPSVLLSLPPLTVCRTLACLAMYARRLRCIFDGLNKSLYTDGKIM